MSIKNIIDETIMFDNELKCRIYNSTSTVFSGIADQVTDYLTINCTLCELGDFVIINIPFFTVPSMRGMNSLNISINDLPQVKNTKCYCWVKYGSSDIIATLSILDNNNIQLSNGLNIDMPFNNGQSVELVNNIYYVLMKNNNSN
jgi:hypothetical protein